MAKQPDIMAPPPIRMAAPRAKMTIYFALLIISFMAMLIACLFLYLEIRRFGGFKVVPGKVSAAARPGPMLLVYHGGTTSTMESKTELFC